MADKVGVHFKRRVIFEQQIPKKHKHFEIKTMKIM